MEFPLVSCLMLTYNRFTAFKEAVECFTYQTYQNKQLVIINSGSFKYRDKVCKYLKNFEEYNIKHIEIKTKYNDTIGYLRNMGLVYSDGEYIMGFDDDDIHHRERISKQIKLCLNSNIDGTILKNFIAKCGSKKNNCSILHGLEGTLLFKNPNQKIEYEFLNQGEDTNFILKLKKSGYKIAVIDENFDMYVYQFHGNNTVGKKHFNDMIELNPPIRK